MSRNDLPDPIRAGDCLRIGLPTSMLSLATAGVDISTPHGAAAFFAGAVVSWLFLIAGFLALRRRQPFTPRRRPIVWALMGLAIVLALTAPAAGELPPGVA